MIKFCECGNRIKTKYRFCEYCRKEKARSRNKKKYADIDEGLKPYQKHGSRKSYQEILEEARKRDPILYKENKLQNLWN